MGGGRRRSPPPPPPAPPAPVTATTKGSDRDADTMVDIAEDVTGSSKLGRRRRGKRALVGQSKSAAQVGGEGSSGLNIPKG